MRIYLDESGTFAPSSTTSVSVVGALIVPEHKADTLFQKYAKLRCNLPKDKGEVKGRLLNEEQVVSVTNLLHKNTCIFEAVAIDLALESSEGLATHQMGQAEGLTNHLTPQHQPGLIADMWNLRGRLEDMPLQLYVQSVVTMQLLGNIIRKVPAFWSLRQLKEILTYHWVIDGKAVGQVTDAEDWWSTTMLGLMQTRSYREPMIAPDWVDYTAFDAKFRRDMPEWLLEHMPGSEQVVDLRLLMKESFRFSSDPEPGLELVDIVTNATRRALMGRLDSSGWMSLPRLMIHNARAQYIQLITLSAQPIGRPQRPYAGVLANGFRSGGRSMLTRCC